MTKPSLDEIKKVVKEINVNRSKHIELFTNAFLAANAPKDFDYAWVLKNCVLCTRTIYENGVMTDQFWIELRK